MMKSSLRLAEALRNANLLFLKWNGGRAIDPLYGRSGAGRSSDIAHENVSSRQRSLRHEPNRGGELLPSTSTTRASKWNKALLDNSARPSGALVYAASNGQMTGEQFQRLKDELETSYQGARHAGRPLLLEGGLDWKPLSLSPKDMDFIEAKNLAARRDCLGDGRATAAFRNSRRQYVFQLRRSASRAFWRGTVLPLVNRMSRAFGSWLSPAFGSVLEVRPDLDSVEALNAGAGSAVGDILCGLRRGARAF